MRRLDSAIPVGHQALSDVTKLCVRECVSKYRVFDRSLLDQKHFRTSSVVNDQRKRRESQNSVLTLLRVRCKSAPGRIGVVLTFLHNKQNQDSI
jgi:hypothetical protein